MPTVKETMKISGATESITQAPEDLNVEIAETSENQDLIVENQEKIHQEEILNTLGTKRSKIAISSDETEEILWNVFENSLLEEIADLDLDTPNTEAKPEENAALIEPELVTLASLASDTSLPDHLRLFAGRLSICGPGVLLNREILKSWYDPELNRPMSEPDTPNPATSIPDIIVDSPASTARNNDVFQVTPGSNEENLSVIDDLAEATDKPQKKSGPPTGHVKPTRRPDRTPGASTSNKSLVELKPGPPTMRNPENRIVPAPSPNLSSANSSKNVSAPEIRTVRSTGTIPKTETRPRKNPTRRIDYNNRLRQSPTTSRTNRNQLRKPPTSSVREEQNPRKNYNPDENLTPRPVKGYCRQSPDHNSLKRIRSSSRRYNSPPHYLQDDNFPAVNQSWNNTDRPTTIPSLMNPDNINTNYRWDTRVNIIPPLMSQQPDVLQPLENRVIPSTNHLDVRRNSCSIQRIQPSSTTDVPRALLDVRCAVCRSRKHYVDNCPRVFRDAINALNRGKRPLHNLVSPVQNTDRRATSSRYEPYPAQYYAPTHPRDFSPRSLIETCRCPTCPWKLRGYNGPFPGDGIGPCLDPYCQLKPGRY